MTLLRTDLPRLHLDMETRSPVNLPKSGVHRYAKSPATSVILFRARFGSYGDMIKWKMGDPLPYLVVNHIGAGGTVVAHNAAFERTLWNKVMRRDYPSLPEMKIEQMDCTMSRCAVLGIPQGLDFAAQVLSCDYRKDKEGQALMMRMCRPRARKECEHCHGSQIEEAYGGHGTVIELSCSMCSGAGETYTWWDDAERIARLGQYCEADVLTETAVDEKAPPLSDREREVWEFDQRVNDRGVMLDVPLIHRLIDTVEIAKKQLDKRMSEITAGFVKKCTQPAKIAEWITLMGVPCTSVAKGEQEELLIAADAQLNPTIREVIELRQQASKSSTAKLSAMLACVCADGRARGQLFYHGAMSGRWAGRLIQPHNLYRIDEERDGADVDRVIGMAVAVSDPKALHSAIDIVFGQPMTQIAKTMRSMFISAPGKKFVGGDKSNIEGRINAWIANEDWKLRAFRDYDAGVGPDLYRVAYSRSFGVSVEQVGKGEKRQVGKVQELACISGDQMVLTNKGLIPLFTLTLLHKVWDGVAWVSHQGLIDRGERETQTYCGLTATPDHIVYREDTGAPISFGDAAATRTPILRSGFDQHAVRLGLRHPTYSFVERQMGGLPSVGALYVLWGHEMALSGAPSLRQVARVPELFAPFASAALVDETFIRGAGQMYESGESWLQKLWRTWDRISLSVRARRRTMAACECCGRQVKRIGPRGQQRPLRSRELALCDACGSVFQSTSIEDTGLPKLGKSVFACDDETFATCGIRTGRNTSYGGAGNSGEAKKLAHDRRKVRVYDILNAGPHNRFTVSGVLVHNCGYQGSVGAYISMGKNYRLSPSDMIKPVQAATGAQAWDAAAKLFDKANNKHGLGVDAWTAVSLTVKAWREAHPNIVQGWWDLQDAAIAATTEPGTLHPVFNGRVRYVADRGFLWCSLPSKRLIAYCAPRIVTTKVTRIGRDGEPYETWKKSVHFDGYDSVTRRWCEQSLYGGMQCAHVVSGLARDLIVEDAFEAERRGYPVVLTVHDELLNEVPAGFGSDDEMNEIMCMVPSYTPGLPLSAAAWQGDRY